MCVRTFLCVGLVALGGAPRLPRAAAQDETPPPSDPPATTTASATNLVGIDATAPEANHALFTGPWMRFHELSFDLGFEAESQRRSTVSDARSIARYRFRLTDTYRSFEETVGARGDGFLLDERFALFRFDTRWGLSQQRFDESRPGADLHDDPEGTLLHYDARLTMFPAGTLTVNAFALNADDRIPRPFLPSLDRRRERYGVELLYNDRVLPMRLSYESTWEELTSRRRELYDDERRRDRELSYEVTWQPSERQQLRLSYEYSDECEQYSGSRARLDTLRHYLALDHVLTFGPNDRSRLETIARFQDESGDFARDVYELASQLRLQHGERLSTHYKAQGMRQSFAGATMNLYRGDIGVQHQMDDWLTSSAYIYGLRQAAELGGDTNEWGTILTSSLWRTNDLGRLSATLSYTHSQLRSDPDRLDGVVVNEAVTFRDPLPGYLLNTAVNRLSLVVTDLNRRATYAAGRDFLIIGIGRYTALIRVRDGRILDGETVLVSYTYATTQGLEISRDRVDLRVYQELKNGFTPYYAATIQLEAIDRHRFLRYEPRDINRHRAGVNLRRRRLSAGAEYEYNDDSIDPYHGVHLTADATLVSRAPHNLDWNGSLSYLRFHGAEGLRPRAATLVDTGIVYRCLFNRDLEGNLAARYRFEGDSIDGRTQGVDLSAALNWKIGLLTAIFEVEYDQLNLPGSRDGTFVAWVKLKREIPFIARAER